MTLRSWSSRRPDGAAPPCVRGSAERLVWPMTIYAIGDIHGHLDKLRGAHDLVEADRAREGTREAPLVHLGDLVDRGPDSAGVVGHLRDLALQDPSVVVLKGNHDFDVPGIPRDPPRPLVRKPLPASRYRRTRDTRLLRPARDRIGPRAARQGAGRSAGRPPRVPSTRCPFTIARANASSFMRASSRAFPSRTRPPPT